MKRNGKSKFWITRFALMAILTIAFLFAMTGCSDTKPQSSPTPALKATLSPAPAQTPPAASPLPTASAEKAAVKIDTPVKALTEEDKVLSLGGYGSKGALADKNLSIADMLMYAVQDEYLARGEYKAIIDKFGSQNPFSNIILSEETHLAALKELYTAYGLKFPDDTSAGHTVIPDSILQANKTGVQAEIDNIAMYERFLTYDLPQPVKDVFVFLKTASGSHLSAFQKQVEKLS